MNVRLRVKSKVMVQFIMLCVDGHGSGWDNEGRNLAARDMAQLELE